MFTTRGGWLRLLPSRRPQAWTQKVGGSVTTKCPLPATDLHQGPFPKLHATPHAIPAAAQWTCLYDAGALPLALLELGQRNWTLEESTTQLKAT